MGREGGVRLSRFTPSFLEWKFRYWIEFLSCSRAVESWLVQKLLVLRVFLMCTYIFRGKAVVQVKLKNCKLFVAVEINYFFFF